MELKGKAALLGEVEDEAGLHLTPRDLPLSRRSVLDSWRFLQRPRRQGTRQELDLQATIDRISQEGYFSDVVMRPVRSKRAELLVLVDDSNGMIPFRPAIEPLVTAIQSRQVSPAQLYRFTTYPDDYLYDWQVPSRAVPLDQVLSRLHPRRTIVAIWSEGGATRRSEAVKSQWQEHRQGLIQFLDRLRPCVGRLIWLNPLPPERWPGTLAGELACLLDGRMIQPGGQDLLDWAKQPMGQNPICLRRGD